MSNCTDVEGIQAFGPHKLGDCASSCHSYAMVIDLTHDLPKVPVFVLPRSQPAIARRMAEGSIMNSTHIELAVSICKSNPGAMSVMAQAAELLSNERLTNFMLDVKAIGITGPLLWLAYKDNCLQNIVKLIDRVAAHDKTLLERV